MRISPSVTWFVTAPSSEGAKKGVEHFKCGVRVRALSGIRITFFGDKSPYDEGVKKKVLREKFVIQ